MGTFRVIPKELKEQILSRIKNNGVSVAQASKDHGVSIKTIYTWLNKGLEKQNVSYGDFNKLRKQNDDLLKMVGYLTLEVKKLKKN